MLDDDTAETLAARVFEAECEAYPEAIQLIADGESGSRDAKSVFCAEPERRS